jgi:tetratricopeptide (TPR) repeat protein
MNKELDTKTFFILLLIFLFFAIPSFAETIILKSGKTIEGKILIKTDSDITVDDGRATTTYYIYEIESIDGKPFATGKSSFRNLNPPIISQVKLAKNNFSSYYKKGITCALEGNFKEAEDEFKKAIAVDKHDYSSQSTLKILADFKNGIINKEYTIYLFQGLEYLYKQEYEQAIEEFKKALEINPSYINAYLNIGVARYYISSAFYGPPSRYGHEPHRVRIYTDRGTTFPNDIHLYFELVPLYFHQDLGDMAPYCDKAIRLNPDNFVPYYINALMNIYSGRSKEAKPYYEETVKRGAYADAYIGLGYCKIYEAGMNPKALSEAISCFKKAIEIDPNNNLAYAILASINEAFMNKYQQAIFFYQKAIEINPYDIIAYNNIGGDYVLLGQPEKAKAYFKKALQIDPYSFVTYINLGQTYNFLSQYHKTVACIQKGIKMQKGEDIYNEDAYYVLGIAYQSLKQYDAAIECFHKAKTKHRGDSYFRLGEIYVSLGNYEKAKEELENAKKLYQQENHHEKVKKVEEHIKNIP